MPWMEVDVDNMVRMNTDALALLGHISFETPQRRRDAIRPTLHKDYVTLCASRVPITNFLFGDELQTQLNHNCASNKIISITCLFHSINTSGNQQHWKPFLRKTFPGNQSFKKSAPYQHHWKKQTGPTDQK